MYNRINFIYYELGLNKDQFTKAGFEPMTFHIKMPVLYQPIRPTEL